MSKLQVNIDDDLKKEAEALLEALGFSPKLAITVFYKQVLEQGKIPFPIELSEESLLAFKLKKRAETQESRVLDTEEKIDEWFNEDEY